MTAIKTDETAIAVIKTLQEGIPLVREPFKVLSQEFGVNEEELLNTIKLLKDQLVLRQISPIYDTKMLGYDSALVTFKVRPGDIEAAAEVINSHPGVSHNYEKGHGFNLWFTIAVPPDSRLGLDKTVSALASMVGTEEYAVLRSRRVFKICVKLDPAAGALKREETKTVNRPFIALSEDEKQTVRITQLDIPLTKRPFWVYAEVLGTDEGRLIKKLVEFKQRGVMRRFAAIPNHRRLGFTKNAMVVGKVPEELAEEIGARIASFKAVSHCYERTTNGVWPYNLFAMIHAKTGDEVSQIISEMKSVTGLKDFSILYSEREFKKRRVRYFIDDFYNWEEGHIPPPPLPPRKVRVS